MPRWKPRAGTSRWDKACGILFGREKSGLHNEDIAVSEAIVAVPVNPAFASLNLAQAVLILAYEWFLSPATTRRTETSAKGPRVPPPMTN